MGAARDPDAIPDLETIRRMPKVDLHCHLDGAVRPETLLDLSRASGIPLPADTVEELIPHVTAGDRCRSLRDFLAVFDTFYPVLKHPGALERVGYELMHDCRDDGVVHVEARWCPHLQASDGHDAEQVVREALAGLAAGAKDTGVSFGAILCCYRSLPPAASEEIVDLALKYRDRGVVGLDLAGPEDLSAVPHVAAMTRGREAGLPLTVHAGEAAGPESIREAMDLLKPRRIGHGVALRESPELALRVAESGVAIECCPTSNVRTGAIRSLDEHPFDELRRVGARILLATDDPRVCGVALSDEYALAVEVWGLSPPELEALAHVSREEAFASRS